MVKHRSALERIPAYKQGAMPSTSDVVKLSSNENPFPPLASVREAVALMEHYHISGVPVVDDQIRLGADGFQNLSFTPKRPFQPETA